MKKIEYTQPAAEMVLLQEDDVIHTSLTKVTIDASIDDAGIPTTKW